MSVLSLLIIDISAYPWYKFCQTAYILSLSSINRHEISFDDCFRIVYNFHDLFLSTDFSCPSLITCVLRKEVYLRSSQGWLSTLIDLLIEENFISNLSLLIIAKLSRLSCLIFWISFAFMKPLPTLYHFKTSRERGHFKPLLLDLHPSRWIGKESTLLMWVFHTFKIGNKTLHFESLSGCFPLLIFFPWWYCTRVLLAIFLFSACTIIPNHLDLQLGSLILILCSHHSRKYLVLWNSILYYNFTAILKYWPHDC